MQRFKLGVLGVALGAVACGDTVKPPTVASVSVTSPIGDRMAVGRTVQLSAEARDSRGSVVSGVTFTWTSSAPSIAEVDGTGQVSGLAAGSATFSAEGSGVTGTLGMRVIAADLSGITTDVNDPFTTSLAANLTNTVRSRVQTALGQCASGAAQGNFTVIEGCLASVRAEVAAATDPTDRALLASLALFLDHVERLLNV